MSGHVQHAPREPRGGAVTRARGAAVRRARWAAASAALLGVALLSGGAVADPIGTDAVPEVAGGPPVGSAAQPAGLTATPPPGWTEMPGLAKSVATALEQSGSFGALRGRAGARAWARPGTGAFYLSWLVAGRPAEPPEAAVRRAFDRLREARVAASPQARSTEELRYADGVDDGVAEAHLEWRHLSNETMSLVRALAWVSPAGVPTLAKAECVIGAPGGTAPPAVVARCRTALASLSLSLSLPAGSRGSLSALAPSTPPAEQRFAVDAPPGGADSVDGQGHGGASGPATLGAVPTGAEGHVLYRGPAPRQHARGMSGWLIAIGVGILLIAVLVTVRSRVRRDLEREPDDGEGVEADDDAEVEAAADGDDPDDADPAGSPDPSEDAGEDDKNA